ncbi:hypothetical protein ACB098_02G080900 [Castanea mollissima]
MAKMESNYDRRSELKALDESKAGVKGLIDAGVEKIPRIFIHEQNKQNNLSDSSFDSKFSIPVIDFEGINKDVTLRDNIVNKVRDACENWGFFQIVNHGVEVAVLDEIIDSIRGFHEQDLEVKKKIYTRDLSRSFAYNTNFDLYKAQAANWRDTIYCSMAPCPPNPAELPEVCRDIMIDCSNKVMNLGLTISELLSEALGLNPNHLKDMGCVEGLYVLGHFYPACPEPDLTLGLTKHSDATFLTILLQDQIGGFQVLYQNQWVDVIPIPGSVLVNLGGMIQLISNDKFKSVFHRVLARNVGPRISVACFFRTHNKQESTHRLYGPIKELDTTVKDYVSYIHSVGLNGNSRLEYFKI